MKVYDDKLMMELKEYDLTKGYLEPAKLIIGVHPAEPRKVHLETLEGTDGDQYEVEDAPAKPAWNETEDVMRYIPYSAQQLEQMKQEEKDREEQEKAYQEQLAKKLQEENAQKILLDRLDAQITFTALKTGTLLTNEE